MKQKLSLLLIEDDPEDQEFFLETLSALIPDAGCYAVSNGQEALQVLLCKNFLPDFIFTDLQMPIMGGLEFVQKLKSLQTLKDIPVYVYSGGYSEDDIRIAKSLGVVGIYSKTRKIALKEILKMVC